MTEDDLPAEEAPEANESAEAALIAAFSDFVRASRTGDGLSPGHERLLSVADAAEYLNVSTTTVRNLAVGARIRSTRIGDRLRFRRAWLDEFIDAGGGDVPAPPPSPPTPARPQADRARATVRRARPSPPPKPPNYIQRIGDQDLRLLSDGGSGRFKRLHTWHLGDRTALCGHQARWTGKTERWPHAFVCAACLTALAALAGADLAKFGVGRLAMLRTTQRGSTTTAIRAGYHVGDGRRTMCGRTDGPWSLTERFPRTRECFVCEHRQRWEARKNDPNQLSPRPLTPLRVLVDAGHVDPRLRALFDAHPSSLDARQASEPFTERMRWDTKGIVAQHNAGARLNAFAGYPSYLERPAGDWVVTISERDGVALADVDRALEQVRAHADTIERALSLYARWARELRPSKSGRPTRTGRAGRPILDK